MLVTPTDSDGRYVVRVNPKFDAATVSVSAPGMIVERTITVKLSSSLVDAGRVVMVSNLSVLGQVFDESLIPIDGAAVSLFDVDSDGAFSDAIAPVRHVVTDTGGLFTFSRLDAGEYRIVAEAEGYPARLTSDVRLSPQNPTIERSLVFEGTVVFGNVVDSRGAGLPGIDVEGRDGFRRIARDTTDENGGFDLGVFADGSKVQLTAYKDGFQHSRSLHIVSGISPVRIALKGSGTLIGRATEVPSGNPLSNLDLLLVSRDVAPSTTVGSISRSGVSTAKDGVFSVSELPAGVWEIRAQATGFEPIAVGRVSIIEGDETEEILFEFRTAVTVKGVVVDERSGLGIADSTVEFYVPHSGRYAAPVRSAKTSENGEFQLADVNRDGGTLVVSARDFAPTRMRLTASKASSLLEIGLRPGVILIGILRTADGGDPVRGAVTLSNNATGSGHRRATGSDGEFRFTGLGPGTYTITATSDFGVAQKQTIMIDESSSEFEKEVSLLVEPGSTVFGRLIGLGPATIAGARIFASGPDGFSKEGIVDSVGKYSIVGVPPGHISLTARLPSNLTIAKSIDVSARASAQVDFGFGHRGVISGTLSASGGPVSGATISAFPSSQGAPYGWATTNDSGEFRIDGLASNRYTLRVNGQHDRDVHVGDATKLNIDITALPVPPE